MNKRSNDSYVRASIKRHGTCVCNVSSQSKVCNPWDLLLVSNWYIPLCGHHWEDAVYRTFNWSDICGHSDNPVLAPVPLSIFRSNSKFDENSERSSFEYTRPITTIFCTRHDSDTVVTCAKYRCDLPRIFYTRVFWIFIEFRIRSKDA